MWTRYMPTDALERAQEIHVIRELQKESKQFSAKLRFAQENNDRVDYQSEIPPLNSSSRCMPVACLQVQGSA
jgi:hypothetical protein